MVAVLVKELDGAIDRGITTVEDRELGGEVHKATFDSDRCNQVVAGSCRDRLSRATEEGSFGHDDAFALLPSCKGVRHDTFA